MESSFIQFDSIFLKLRTYSYILKNYYVKMIIIYILTIKKYDVSG